MEWKQWCRLCGKENGNEINIFIKNESIPSISDAIQRFFSIEILNIEESSKHICILCNNYLLSLNNFADRIANVQQLFIEIESNFKSGSKIDLNELRLKYINVPSSIAETFYITKLRNNEEEFKNKENIELIHDNKNKENHNINNSDVKISKQKKNFDKNNINILDIDGNVKDICNNTNENSKLKGTGKRKQKAIKSATPQVSDTEDSSDFDNCINDNSSDKSSINETINSQNEKHEETNKIKKVKQLENNKKRIYKTGEKNFECDECHQKFTRESNYIYHIKKTHKGLPPCEICGKICKTKQKLRLHLELHLPPEEREKLLYKCPHCDKKFTQSAKVKEHVRAIHLQEKPFVCEQCGKNFASQSNLCSHKRIHDNQSRLNCSLCPKIFNNSHKLRFHIKYTHNSTGHTCSVCGQVLKTRKTLRNHMLIHSDAKPFKCNYCGKDFKRDKNLQIHMITHTGLKPFPCRFCTQSYAHRSNCKKHEKHLHPIEYEAAAAIVNNEPQQLIQKKLPNIAQLKAMLEQLKNERELPTVNNSTL